MSRFIAALPMYDWPERRDEVDAEWAAIRRRLVAQGVDAPEQLVRRNADLPPVPGGIRNADGSVVGRDPAVLPPDELDLPTLWRHPALLFAQTCWGPLETTGLARHVSVIGQPDYSAFPGGSGTTYRSAIVMRGVPDDDVPPPRDPGPTLQPDRLKEAVLAFNSEDSMSGTIALSRDLEAAGLRMSIFGARIETGGHRGSILAVAEGRADVAAIDCRTLAIARRHEKAAADVVVIGWTAARPGLPFIRAIGGPAYDLD